MSAINQLFYRLFPSDEDKKEVQSELEVQKLKNEVELGNKQIENFSKTQKLEVTKVRLSFWTIIIAVVGFLGNSIYQQIQINTLRQQHADDQIVKNIQQLSSATTEAGRVAAISVLSPYLQSPSPAVRQQIIDLLVNYVEADSSDAIQGLIQQTLVGNASVPIMNSLIQQNRRLLSRNWDTLWQYSADNPNRYKKIIWNINSLVRCINVLKQIRNVDFSQTVLSYVIVKMDDSSHGAEYVTNTLDEGVSFDGVSFDHTVLTGVDFESVKFYQVKFDGSHLCEVRFDDCIFDNHCSFKDFEWYCQTPTIPEAYRNNLYPNWYSCTGKIDRFCPRTDLDLGLEYFSDSKIEILDSCVSRDPRINSL